ncbi:MAG: pyridoxamine 5'-phosphate oxidase family protein [Candidatus Dormibacteria bacterium]
MPRANLSDFVEFAGLDRFLQWDLVTVNPWGVPSVAAVGARVKVAENAIWTSTTVGYAAKVRNLRLNPRVTMLRSHGDLTAIVLRGEATVEEGGGTENLAHLFELMQGPEGVRPFFADTTTNPGWRWLYREYWRRILIRIRIVEVEITDGESTRKAKVDSWARPARAGDHPRARGVPRRRLALGTLDARGRQMIADKLPAVLAVGEVDQRAPLVLPVEARQDRAGRLLVRAAVLAPGEFRKASLAVRVIDDSFELARTVAWVGTISPGAGWREFQPRSVYGFTKPPGWLPDLAAGLAAAVMSAKTGASRSVSAPSIQAASRRALAVPAEPLRLSRRAWNALEVLFSSCNATAPVYAGLAVVASAPSIRSRLSYLHHRAEMERDWAHALLIHGRRQISPLDLVRGAIRMRPQALDPLAEAVRQDLILERSRSVLRVELPEPLRSGITRELSRENPSPAPPRRDRSGLAAISSLATSASAAVDRLGRQHSSS